MVAQPGEVADDATPDKAGIADKVSAADQASAADKTGAGESAARPAPDPATCRGMAISEDRFQQAILDGQFADTEYLYYLEPAGVLSGPLLDPDDEGPAGILMTKAAHSAHVVFLDDGVNPERYDLSFPKEFGYVKSIQHYEPHSREHAKYPWSKRF